MQEEKTLNNIDTTTTKENTSDIEVFGNPDLWKLISKASSQSQGWMKSTKAMQIGRQVVIQVTTQQRNTDGTYAVAEALIKVDNAVIMEIKDEEGSVIGREIESI